MLLAANLLTFSCCFVTGLKLSCRIVYFIQTIEQEALIETELQYYKTSFITKASDPHKTTQKSENCLMVKFLNTGFLIRQSA